MDMCTVEIIGKYGAHNCILLVHKYWWSIILFTGRSLRLVVLVTVFYIDPRRSLMVLLVLVLVLVLVIVIVIVIVAPFKK